MTHDTNSSPSVVSVLGSGRQEGNSAQLGEAARTGVESVGAVQFTRVDLARLTFHGCTGCLACRTGAANCVLEDDLAPVLAQTATATALVLASPIYYGYPTGLFKSFLDRWYAFRDAARRLRVPAGRPALLIVTQGHPDPAAYTWTLDSLRKVLSSYGFETSVLVAAGLEGAGSLEERPDLLLQARELGAELGRALRAG